MVNLLEKVTGDLAEKKRWRRIQARAKALPEEYAVAYKKIQKYIWNSAAIETIEPFENLVDLFEDAAVRGKAVLEITGQDVAAFADELVKGEKSYFEKLRTNLNRVITKKLD
jgi:DNA-binding ferritin-like protein (Dps family)